MEWVLRFQDGTVIVDGAKCEDLPTGFLWDHRIQAPRGPAFLYPLVVYRALERQIPYKDLARQWKALDDLKLHLQKQPRKYQNNACQAWLENNRRGIVVLPTGSGKSFVAELLISIVKRPTLIIAPTLDLVGQWYDNIRTSFDEEVGILGGGFHEVRRLTISTYDSAQLYLSKYGDRFCFLIYDEVHHLPSPSNILASKTSMAPFRLGLTATLEREDGRESILNSVLGNVVFRKEITELSGSFLADYEVVRIWVDLSEEELQAYQTAREEYLSFLKEKQIVMSSGGWNVFLREASRSKIGRQAFLSYQIAKRISHGADSKIRVLGNVLARERGRKTLVFTNDNATAYKISNMFLIPCITHQTDVKERRSLLGKFASGTLPILVTSRVLNEGVDIPEAEVAVVLSGTGTVREHVQRLGRILRPRLGKKAIMYELVAAGTTEHFTSERRRRHDAYR